MDRKGRVDEILETVLNNRGIWEENEIEEFLSPLPKRTYAPQLLKDLEQGVDLILSEIDKGSRVCIYGDYDVDGITATTLLMSVLSQVAEKGQVDYYIPSRFEEGYGLNKDAIAHIKEQGSDLIVSVDCGSVSAAEVEFAKAIGLKIVVTDHHNVGETMADCLLINPRRADSEYPFSGLSGCGVAFKLAQKIKEKRNLPMEVLRSVLDLVAIGTIGDIVPLIDENRTMCKYGLREINKGTRYGLRRLMEETGLKQGEVTAENVSFVIVPHLNASGRIETASLAVRLLMAKEGDADVDDMVCELMAKNQERRRLQRETYEMCMSALGGQVRPFILVDLDDAHEGITGIVASNVKDRLKRPTIIATPSGDMNEFYKGSGRSVDKVDIYALLKNHEGLFERFGGHRGACGFLMKRENLPVLRRALEEDVQRMYDADSTVFDSLTKADMELKIEDLSVELAERLEILSPFGKENPKPLFSFPKVLVYGKRFLKNETDHMKFFAFSDERREGGLECILFKKALDYDEMVFDGAMVTLEGTLDINSWNDTKRLQLVVSDILSV